VRVFISQPASDVIDAPHQLPDAEADNSRAESPDSDILAECAGDLGLVCRAVGRSNIEVGKYFYLRKTGAATRRLDKDVETPRRDDTVHVALREHLVNIGREFGDLDAGYSGKLPWAVDALACLAALGGNWSWS